MAPGRGIEPPTISKGCFVGVVVFVCLVGWFGFCFVIFFLTQKCSCPKEEQ
jgi:hypothetical protein